MLFFPSPSLALGSLKKRCGGGREKERERERKREKERERERKRMGKRMGKRVREREREREGGAYYAFVNRGKEIWVPPVDEMETAGSVVRH